jgi:hypothetical protein
MRLKATLVKELIKSLYLTQLQFCECVDGISDLGLRTLTKAFSEEVLPETVKGIWERLRHFADLRDRERLIPGKLEDRKRASLPITIARVRGLANHLSLVEDSEAGRLSEADAVISRRLAGTWHGVEHQKELATFKVSLTLRGVAGGENKVEGEYVVTWPPEFQRPVDVQIVKHGTFRKPYVCLEYETTQGADRFGYILLEMDSFGKALKGYVMGLSTYEQPAIGCNQVTLTKDESPSPNA